MPIELTERFRVAYVQLPERIQRKVQKALTLLESNPRRPSLQTKPILGAAGIYEARVDQRYRMTYERQDNVLVMRNVGGHDPTLSNP